MPLDMRPVEERRARAVIEKAISGEGMSPAPPRDVTLDGGAVLSEDMSVADTKYGVAYLTVPEAKALGASIPPYEPDREELRLVRGTDGEVVLILYEQAYEYDAGETHTVTAVTAEAKLDRDVGDFVLHVVKPDKVK